MFRIAVQIYIVYLSEMPEDIDILTPRLIIFYKLIILALTNHKNMKKIFLEPKIPIGNFIIFIILALALGVSAGILAGINRNSNSSARYKLGDEIHNRGLTFVVESVRRDSGEAGPLKPMPGYEYLIAKVALRNNSSEPYDFIPLLYFHLKDTAGNVYDVGAAPTLGGQLSGPVLPNDALREEIGFEVPKGAENLVFYFEPGKGDHAIFAITLGEKP